MRKITFAVLVAYAATAVHGAVVLSGNTTSVQDYRNSLTVGFTDRTNVLHANRNGVSGSWGTPDAQLAVISSDTDLSALPDAVVALVEEAYLGELLASAATDPLVTKLQGVIVLPYCTDCGAAVQPMASPASQQPFRQFYEVDHVWNPAGLDLLDTEYPFPITLADVKNRADLLQRAGHNGAKGFAGPSNFAKVSAVMYINETGSSLECLAAEGQCVPLGGNTVWASMPPLATDGPSMQRAIWVVSHWDSRGLFQSETQGAESAYSGLVAMLVAADALRAADAASFNRTIVFVALAGEAFDLMGSRRLMWDISHGANGTAGLDFASADAILELGMLGQAGADGPLYFHAGGESALSAALVAAADSPGSPMVLAASAGADLPPSSLLALRRAPAAPQDLLYLGDFDTAFATASYFSHNDVQSGISARGVAAAAVLAARALHSLVSSDPFPEQDGGAAEALAQDLMDCLLAPGGLGCALVSEMTSAYAPSAEQYVGVQVFLTTDDQEPDVGAKRNVERFVWEFLANRTFTAAASSNDACDPFNVASADKATCGSGEVCMHAHPALKGEAAQGKCVRATARFAPSYSTKLAFAFCDSSNSSCTGAGAWAVVQGDDPDAWATAWGLPLDSVWVETYNEPLSTVWRLKETSARDNLVLGLGLAATALSVVAVASGRWLHARHMKNR